MRDTIARRMPRQIEQPIAGQRLISGLFQKSKELLTGHRIFSERKSVHRNHMLWALGIEPSGFSFGTPHGECSSRYGDHHRAITTFAEFPIRQIRSEERRVGKES